MTSSALRMQHSSLQFSDTRAQQAHDVEQLFKKGTLFPIKTGTEASNTNPLFELIREAAGDYKHVIHNARGNFIAVDRKIIKPGTVKKGEVFIISNDHLVGKMHDRVMPTLVFTHVDPRIGRVAVSASHFATKGAKPGQPNYKANVLYSRKIGEWMRTAGRGSAIAFNAGDYNTNDRELDWTHGQNYTSMADELGAWQNTGHGPIDGFCSYDRDGRVKARSFVVLDDSEMKMHTDHYVCRGTWMVRHLKVK
jgi:hypothetical protein